MKKGIIILLHLGYWMMYLLLLLLLFSLTIIPHTPSFEKQQFLQLSLFWWGRLLFGFAIVPGIITFYSFYSLLYKEFVNKNTLGFFSYLIIIAIVSCAIGQATMYFTIPETNWSLDAIMGMGIIMIVNALANGAMGLLIKAFIVFYSDIKLKEELSKKNYDMELALIKSQIEPHFLFNTINNIDVLIEKDAIKASEYLKKLSDIMRFMLYDTKAATLPLKSELEYIQKYIDLQRIRTSNPDYVSLVVNGEVNNKFIQTMLFIPFIENAFKHTENNKKQNAIKINFRIENQKIIFECENLYTGTHMKTEHKGLGNELIRRRLELLYPKNHELLITDEDGCYKVNLVIGNDN